MDEPVKVACAQVEPVIFDRDATLDKVATVAADVAAKGAKLVLFPETFVPVYPSSRWARTLAGWGQGGKELWARLARASIAVPSADTDRIGAVAKEHGLVLAVGVNELDGGTLYNTLLVFTPDGELALRHRKLMPTNHERLVWGLGDGGGLETFDAGFGRLGGLICWENFMPLARAALYESGLDIYLAPAADDSESWLESIRHIAREARVRPLELRVPTRIELPGRCPDCRRAGPARSRRLGNRRPGRRVPRRAAVGRGGRARRRTGSRAALHGAPTLRSCRTLLAARRLAAPGHAVALSCCGTVCRRSDARRSAEQVSLT